MAAAYEKSTENLITGYLVAEEVNLSVNESPAVLAERITERQDVTLLSFIRMLGSALVADSATRRARGESLSGVSSGYRLVG